MVKITVILSFTLSFTFSVVFLAQPVFAGNICGSASYPTCNCTGFQMSNVGLTNQTAVPPDLTATIAPTSRTGDYPSSTNCCGCLQQECKLGGYNGCGLVAINCNTSTDTSEPCTGGKRKFSITLSGIPEIWNCSTDPQYVCLANASDFVNVNVYCQPPVDPYPILDATCKVNNGTSAITITPGTSVTWSVDRLGGTGNYTQSWSGTDGLSSSLQSFTKQYTSTGLKTANLTVTSGSQSVNPGCPTVTVSSDYRCWVKTADPVTTNSADVNIDQSGNTAWLNYNATEWVLNTTPKGITNDNNGSPVAASFASLEANKTYSVYATRYSTANPSTPRKICTSNAFTTGSVQQGSWTGTCSQGGTYFNITGSQGTTWAYYSGGHCGDNPQNCIWQGASVPSSGSFSHSISPDQYFTWKVDGDGDGIADSSLDGYCPGSGGDGGNPPGGDPPVPDGNEAGTDVYLKYNDGTVYDGFGAPGIGLYSWESGYTPNRFLTNLDGTDGSISCPVNGWDDPKCDYGSQCAYHYWTKDGYSDFTVTYNKGWCEDIGDCGPKASCIQRVVQLQFPLGFNLNSTFRAGSEGGGSVYVSGNGGIAITTSGWHPVWDVTVRPPVTLTVNKTGQGTVAGAPVNNSESFTQTREGWNGSADPQTLSLSCSPGNVITGYSSTYGNGANGNPSGGDCWNPVSACGSCTPGSNSCSVTYNHTNCNHNDAWYCADAKLNINCAPPSISCGTSCTQAVKTYYKTSRTASQNTYVTLTATPSDSYVFAGWSSTTGDCAGNLPTCTVLMDNSKEVTAAFTLPPKTLTVKKAGAGEGGVDSIPAGIYYCSSSATPPSPGCSKSFTHGTSVELKPNYNNNNTIFRGWSEGCSGIGTCRVTMDQNRSVTATFDQVACSYLKTVGGDVYSGTGISAGCAQ